MLRNLSTDYPATCVSSNFYLANVKRLGNKQYNYIADENDSQIVQISECCEITWT